MEKKRLKSVSYKITRRTRILGRYRNPGFSDKRLRSYNKTTSKKEDLK